MNQQWRQYRALELIPDEVPEPQVRYSWLTRCLLSMWQSIVEVDTEQLTHEQRLERLEQHWQLDGTESLQSEPSGFWGSLWVALNQPLFRTNPTYSEPEIQPIIDPSGRRWWCARDPKTGQQTFLESEEEIQIWLEERFYH